MNLDNNNQPQNIEQNPLDNPEVLVDSSEYYATLFEQDPDAFVLGLEEKAYNPELIDNELFKKIKKHKKKLAKVDSRKSFKYLMLFMRPYRKALILMFLVSMIVTGLTIFTIFILQNITSLVGAQIMGVKPESLTIPNFFSSDNTLYSLGATVGFIVGMYAVTAIFSLILNYGLIKISQMTGKKIRRELFNKIQMLPVSYFDQNSSGNLMSRFTNDVNNITNALSQNFNQILNGIFMAVGMIIGMFVESSYLALVTLALLPFMFFGMMQIIKKAQPLYRKQQNLIGALNGFAEEMISGQDVINLFKHQEEINKRFVELSNELADVGYKGHKINSMIFPWAIFFQNFIVFFVVFVGILIYLDPSKPGFGGIGQASNPFEAIATVTAFSLFLRNFLQPIGQIGNTMTMIQAALAGAGRSFEILDLRDEFKDYEKLILNIAASNGDYPGLTGRTAARIRQELINSRVRLAKLFDRTKIGEDVITVSGNVKVENLNFSYIKGKQILKNINFTALEGKTVAIVGPTGSGKSTFINLLTKFYDIEDGDILFDDYSIKNIKKESMRNNVSIVLQDTFLFNESVKDNIKFANLNATDEEIVEAAKIANAHNFIMQMPNGYDTVLEDNAENLSLGQRQLLAIARAVLSRSNILILDEATSSVDTKTELEIQHAMLRLMENKTSFVIAHRLSTIQNADKILVLKDGEIIESGNHNQLLALNGFYANLFNSQFSED